MTEAEPGGSTSQDTGTGRGQVDAPVDGFITSASRVAVSGAVKGASNLTLAPSPQAGEVVCKLTLSGIAEEFPAGRDFLTMAEQEGRNAILIELNPEYMELAKQRTQQKSLLAA